MSRRVFITGISGQDGSYLAEKSLARGDHVFGTVRPELAAGLSSEAAARLQILPVRLDRPEELDAAIRDVKPDECYHLGGPSAVDGNRMGDRYIISSTVDSTRALLNAIVAVRPDCRFFFAGSSEMYGRPAASPQNEETSFNPRSNYGFAKLTSHYLVQRFRKKEGLFACTGILYNHESPRRSSSFLPRKVSLGVARIKLGLQERLALGNLDAQRDWGYAPEYVEAMMRMLALAEPQDLVIATGTLHSVRDLAAMAFQAVDLDYRDFVDIDPRFVRPGEATPLCGNSERIFVACGWRAQRSLSSIMQEMVQADLTALNAAHGRMRSI